jgi:hypothetical protein
MKVQSGEKKSELAERITALEQRVADLEVALGNYALQAALNAEVTARQNADAALQAALDTETAAREADVTDLQSQIDDFEIPENLDKLSAYLTIVNPSDINGLSGPHVIFEGVNVHIRSGSGFTDDGGSLLGLGNLIVGYNEVSGGWGRDGSHNLVVGQYHSYTSFGGLVAGEGNSIIAEAAVVTGGLYNSASGAYSSVSGGEQNQAVADWSSVTGGKENFAYAEYSSVNGGRFNETHGFWSTVSGGEANHAEGELSTVLGGSVNVATETDGVVTGISVVEFFEYALDGDRLFNLGEFEFCQSYTETGNCWVFAPGSASGTGDPTNWSMLILDDSTCWAHCF